jgi:hypothetical protein
MVNSEEECKIFMFFVFFMVKRQLTFSVSFIIKKIVLRITAK